MLHLLFEPLLTVGDQSETDGDHAEEEEHPPPSSDAVAAGELCHSVSDNVGEPRDDHRRLGRRERSKDQHKSI